MSDETAHDEKITLGIPQLEDSYRAIDWLTISNEQRRKEGILFGLPGVAKGFTFISISADSIKRYYRQHAERIDKYLPAIELAEEEKNPPKAITEEWQFPDVPRFGREDENNNPHFPNQIGVTEVQYDGSGNQNEEIFDEHRDVFQLNPTINHQFAAMAAIIASNWRYYHDNVAGSSLDEPAFISTYGELRGREIGLPVISKWQHMFHPSTDYLDWGLQSVSRRDSHYFGDSIGYTHVHPGVYIRSHDPNYYDKLKKSRSHKVISALQEVIAIPVIGRSALRYIREKRKNQLIVDRMNDALDQLGSPPSPGDITIHLTSSRRHVDYIVVPPIFADGEKHPHNVPGLVYALMKRKGRWKPAPPYNSGLARFFSTPRTERMEARFIREYEKAVFLKPIPRLVNMLTAKKTVGYSPSDLIREATIPYADLLDPYGIDVYVATLPFDSKDIDEMSFHRVPPSHQQRTNS